VRLIVNNMQFSDGQLVEVAEVGEGRRRLTIKFGQDEARIYLEPSEAREVSEVDIRGMASKLLDVLVPGGQR
jgi:hypothetical protein